MDAMFYMLLGCLVGALVTWLVSYAYYKRAGDDLKNEAEKLYSQTQLILTALEQGGLVELKRTDGVITGFNRWVIRPKGFDSLEIGEQSIGNVKNL